MLEFNKIYLGDCLEVMRNIPDKSIDLVLTDPPYGINAHKRSDKSGEVKQKNGAKMTVKSAELINLGWDKKTPEQEYFDEIKRVSKNYIIFGCNYMTNIEFPAGRLIWDKLNGFSDQYSAEIAAHTFGLRVDTVYYLWRGMFQGEVATKDASIALRQQGNKKLNEKIIHPTQKPVKLFKWILDKYSEEGQAICDPFCGSGTTAIACHDLKRNFICIEKEPEYHRIATDRYNTHKAQLTIF